MWQAGPTTKKDGLAQPLSEKQILGNKLHGQWANSATGAMKEMRDVNLMMMPPWLARKANCQKAELLAVMQRKELGLSCTYAHNCTMFCWNMTIQFVRILPTFQTRNTCFKSLFVAVFKTLLQNNCARMVLVIWWSMQLLLLPKKIYCGRRGYWLQNY